MAWDVGSEVQRTSFVVTPGETFWQNLFSVSTLTMFLWRIWIFEKLIMVHFEAFAHLLGFIYFLSKNFS